MNSDSMSFNEDFRSSINHHRLIFCFRRVTSQALLALSKICRDRPTPVLRGGGLGAMLMFIGFFPISVQVRWRPLDRISAHSPQSTVAT